MGRLIVSAILTIFLGTLVAAAAFSAVEQTSTGAPSSQPWTIQQLLTMSAREAWELSCKNYTEFGKMTQALVDLSAQKRGVIVPDTKEAGQEIGRSIKQCAQADPNQLLYVIVDNAVKNYAAAHPKG